MTASSSVALDFVPRNEAELAACLSDPLWRICSGFLYKIMVKTDDGAGSVVPFRPNRAQRRLIENLWHRNLILKARQLGFCVDPNTRVLTADLRWVRIEDIKEGQEVVAVDEHVPGGRGSARKMRTAKVERVARVHRMAYRIKFDDGREVICTDRHPWLSRKVATDAKWRSISGEGNSVTGKLKVGTKVRWVTKPWEIEQTYEDGWFGGILDGEGSMALPSRAGASVCAAQREGDVFDRMVSYAKTNGYRYRVEEDKTPERDSKFGKARVPKVVFSRMDEIFRLIGVTRPTRFIDRRFWEGRELPGKRNGDVGWATITSIETIGEQCMIDMQTSTGTYIAEGFVSHNTTLVAIMWLDHALFVPDQRCGIIAQDREAAEAIFRDKVKLAYDRLPEVLREKMPLARDSSSELLFAHNNSSVRVATSMRSGTIHRLHVSEFGKICAKFPDKANEVVTGSLPAVPLTGITIIESTAEGQGGEFFTMAQRAEAMSEQSADLTERDYRFHFFPWWQEPGYRMAATNVVMTDKDRQYFAEVEAVAGCVLDAEQRNWYVATRDSDFSGDPEKMWQEYPSCIAGDVLVGTPNGIIPIRDVVADGQVVHAHMNKGVRPVFEVRTKLGYTVRCTDDHPIKTPSGEFRKLRDGLGVGERVVIGCPMLSTQERAVSWSPVPFAEGRIDITAEFAEFLGVFMGDGSFYNGTISVSCDSADSDTVEAVESMFERFLGGGSSRVTGTKLGCTEVRKSSVSFSEPMLALGIVERRENGGLKRKVHVPPYIFQSPRDVVAAFLRGLFEADGFAARDGTSVKFFSKHRHVVQDVQILLLALGIESRVSSQNKKSGGGHEYIGWELVLRADGVRKFAREIGFISARKQGRANLALAKRKTGSAANFDWTDEIVSVDPAGESEVFDITTVSHEFDAGGIIVHNCPKEAFQQSTEGTYYAVQLTAARKDGRVGLFPHVEGIPVNTFWDIGSSDGTAIWFHQRIGAENRFVRFLEGWGEPYSFFVRQMQALGYVWGTHYLPHDGEHKRQMADTIASPIEMLQKFDLGGKWVIVPRVEEVTHGIQLVRGIFSQCTFDEAGCKSGIAHLAQYRKEWNARLGTWSDRPRHDIHSEAADAFRQFAQGFRAKAVVDAPRQRRESPDWRV